MTTFGQRVADDVRCYLATNGLTQSKLTGAVLAELVDRRLKHETIQAAKKKRMATEEDWIIELEREPHLEGVNVRKELAACQFWCKGRAKQCTRRVFTNWLNNASRSAVVSPGGTKPANGDKGAPRGPKGWLAALNERYPDSTLAKGGTFEIATETDYQWSRLTPDIREVLVTLLREHAVSA